MRRRRSGRRDHPHGTLTENRPTERRHPSKASYTQKDLARYGIWCLRTRTQSYDFGYDHEVQIALPASFDVTNQDYRIGDRGSHASAAIDLFKDGIEALWGNAAASPS